MGSNPILSASNIKESPILLLLGAFAHFMPWSRSECSGSGDGVKGQDDNKTAYSANL
jgi:hypothetical protein